MPTIKLGQSSKYIDRYDPALLEPIARKLSRDEYQISVDFMGWDYWNAYELSWLAPSGVPQMAIAEFAFSASSANIVESKSFKYYLNSFNQSVFESAQLVIEHLRGDLTRACEGEVKVRLFGLEEQDPKIDRVKGKCIDQLPCEISTYQPSAELLELEHSTTASGNQLVEKEQLYTHLLKSNCPVTGQPDWATLWVQYSGSKISAVSLLKYLVAFRQYQGFHESCVERIFSDISKRCSPTELCVYARYTRRGGLDINPFRTSEASLLDHLPFGRTLRQ